eukprot:scaffold652670_cov39-Prasinocladus_malaysianus.AAC.1
MDEGGRVEQPAVCLQLGDNVLVGILHMPAAIHTMRQSAALRNGAIDRLADLSTTAYMPLKSVTGSTNKAPASSGHGSSEISTILFSMHTLQHTN